MADRKVGEEAKEMESLDARQPLVEDEPEANPLSQDIEATTEQIWYEFNGEMSREGIREVVIEAASAYEDVRIGLYVPIFLYRDVIQRLRADLDRSPSGEVPEVYYKSAASPSMSAGYERSEQDESFENLRMRLNGANS